MVVCRTGSMTEAAAELRLTQPAISRSVAVLEEHLDAKLLLRQGRPLKPTAAGVRLLGLADRLIRDALALPAAVRATTRARLPSLRLGVLDSLADPFVPQVVRQGRSLAQTLTVATTFDHPLRESFLRHELDAVISTSSYEELPGFVRFQLFQEDLIAVLPASASAPGFTGEDDIRRFAERTPLIRLGAQSSLGTAIEQHLRRTRLDPPHGFACTTIESAIGLVAAGIGWSILTPVCVRKCLHQLPSLRVLPLPGTSYTRTVYLSARAGELDPHAERMADVCRRVVSSVYVDELVTRMPWIGRSLRVTRD